MPFTVAHAAAALPLRRSGLVWSALVLGTFAPDFEYFLRLAPDVGYGHTLPGTFLLTLPLALIVLWLFHAVVKAPVVELLPASFRDRLAEDVEAFRFGGAARFAMILLSILLGIATHLGWDSFTHPNTWVYRHWAILHASLKIPIIGATPLYKLFQHGSTAIGVGILVIWLLVWRQNAKLHHESTNHRVSGRHRLTVLAVVISIALAGAVIRAVVALGLPAGHLAQKRFVGLWVTTLVALLWWQIVLYGAWYKRRTDT
ncbi:MAG: DUF4184 family protein [Acidobacteria bacterium]|nr:DUF4184 family protein [Acidobacteriota bacterium]